MVKTTESKMSMKECEKSAKYKKADIVAIAENLGIDSKGTRKQICERIQSAISTEEQPKSPSPSPSLPGNTTIDASHLEGLSKSALKSMNKTKLGELMKKVGLTVDTKLKKQQMIDSLLAIKPEGGAKKPDDGAKKPDDIFTKSALNSMKKADLTAILKGKGSSTSGKKAELVQRILQMQSGDIPEKTPSPVVNKCFGGLTMKQLMAKKVAELRDMMKSAGIDSIGLKKAEIAEYLCSHDKKCEGTCEGGLVCDVANSICISPELADKRLSGKKSKYEELVLEGKRIVGTKSALAALKAKISEEVEKPIDQLVIPEEIEMPKFPSPTMLPSKPVDGEEIIVVNDQRLPSPKIPSPKISSKPSEGTEIIDVEEILRQIQVGDGEEISELADTQRSVLKCLGLLA